MTLNEKYGKIFFMPTTDINIKKIFPKNSEKDNCVTISNLVRSNL